MEAMLQYKELLTKILLILEYKESSKFINTFLSQAITETLLDLDETIIKERPVLDNSQSEILGLQEIASLLKSKENIELFDDFLAKTVSRKLISFLQHMIPLLVKDKLLAIDSVLGEYQSLSLDIDTQLTS